MNDLAHVTVHHDSAIASELLLDDGENLLSVKLGGQTLNGGQGLAAIALCISQRRLQAQDEATAAGDTNAEDECGRSPLAGSSLGSCPHLLQHHGRDLSTR